MIGMILVTHGRLAEEFVHAMEHVVGEQPDVATVCIGPNDDMEARRREIASAMEGCTVKVTKDGGSALGGSILGLMMLGAAKGDTIEICVEGDQAEARLSELVELVSSKFGED